MIASVSSLRRAAPLKAMTVRAMMSSWLAEVPQGPPDALFGLIDAYNKDPATKKISLGIGAYRGDDGAPYVLPVVRKAEKVVLEAAMNHEYAGIQGVDDFLKVSFEFMYGASSAALAAGRVGGVQVISGTGGLRVAGNFFARFYGAGFPIYLPSPTWANHIPIFKDAGLDVRSYTYYDPETRGLNFAGLCDDMKAAPDGSIFLLHACAHNPTGVDPTRAQWDEISTIMSAKSHKTFFDCAYQGFASGDADVDAYAVRKFVDDGHTLFVTQSFSKNFGLYGERVGALSVVGANADEATRVLSQFKILIRPMYSNPPVYGARLVSAILSDPSLRAEWEVECKGMADRINDVRGKLVAALAAQGSTKSWQHITDQIGMFCYSGLSGAQVDAIKDQYSVYMTQDGRISMAGVTTGNVEYLAEAIHGVTK
jgi:aspartate aminotransferase